MLNNRKSKSRSKNRNIDRQKYNNNAYRGLFYNDTSEKEFYEHGAHFSYKELYFRLSILKALETTKAQKDILKGISNSRNIKMKINKSSKPSVESHKNISVINMIENNNIKVTNLNVNVNLNINNDNSSAILEKLDQIEKTMLSRNNFQQSANYNNVINEKEQDYNSYFNNKRSHRNLTLYNAIKRINYDKISHKKEKIIYSVRNFSKDKQERNSNNNNNKRAISSSISRKKNNNIINAFNKKNLFIN